jgi:hypothetical protein
MDKGSVVEVVTVNSESQTERDQGDGKQKAEVGEAFSSGSKCA